MNIWRINLKTRGETPAQFCLNNQIVGVGWSVETNGQKVTWEAYYDLGMETYYHNNDKGWWPALNAIGNNIDIDDLIWARDKQGVYYLGRITSEWRYETEKKFVDADVVNIRSCQWYKAGTVESVPGKVVRSFIPSRTLQRVNNNTVRIYSKFLYNQLSKSEYYVLENLLNQDIFSLISADDCEDVLALYLQLTKGYLLIPSSCKSDMMNYEYELIHKETKARAVAQVKNGAVDLSTADFSNIDSTVFLFTTKGNYIGNQNEKIVFIDPREIEEFIFSNVQILPTKIRNWVVIFNRLKANLNTSTSKLN